VVHQNVTDTVADNSVKSRLMSIVFALSQLRRNLAQTRKTFHVTVNVYAPYLVKVWWTLDVRSLHSG